jgi:hypothetical protein
MKGITLAAATGTETWEAILIVSLACGALLVLGYRTYRLTKGGPMADVWGGALLALLLTALAIMVGADVAWARWPALVYGLLFGVVVMPIWTLAVLMPLRPGAPDYGFMVLYWISLVTTVVAALAL